MAANGSKIVATAVTLTIAALGVGTIYLPFIADKDKLRGLDEDGGVSGAQRREYERALQEMAQNAGDGRPHENRKGVAPHHQQ
jgi:hypothetical protein